MRRRLCRYVQARVALHSALKSSWHVSHGAPGGLVQRCCLHPADKLGPAALPTVLGHCGGALRGFVDIFAGRESRERREPGGERREVLARGRREPGGERREVLGRLRHRGRVDRRGGRGCGAGRHHHGARRRGPSHPEGSESDAEVRCSGFQGAQAASALSHSSDVARVRLTLL